MPTELCPHSISATVYNARHAPETRMPPTGANPENSDTILPKQIIPPKPLNLVFYTIFPIFLIILSV